MQRNCPLVRDHPRVCGEKLHAVVFSNYSEGSPPRMRGKEASVPRVYGPSGITPAYAGKSIITHDLAALCKDHPRVCGEKFSGKTSNTFHPGSPPRMRGKVNCPGFLSNVPGITPAYAGKRRVRCFFGSVREDHPRVCGEKLMYAALLKYRRGSPPRMRGKVDFPGCQHLSGGITPAYAGKSLLSTPNFQVC